MTTSEIDAPTTTPDADPPAPREIPSVLSLTARRSGRLGTRLLAIIALFAALGVTAFVVKTGLAPSAAPPLERASSDGWKAAGNLSAALRELRPGQPRAPAQGPARQAAAALKSAQKQVEALKLPTSQTPERSRVLQALRADAAWVDAVGSTLANPKSARRADLAGLAKTAAVETQLVAKDIAIAKGTVGGTGRLLSATT